MSSESEEVNIMEDKTNETLAFLKVNYPQILSVVPYDVLSFGFPSRTICLIMATVTSALVIISVIGNSLMFYVYGR
jgi:hypothetical protein